MDTLESIRQRRSIKEYDPQFVMPEEDKQQILSLALLAPTAFNIQNWRFVVVSDPGLRQQVRDVAWDQSQVTDASLFIILCGDLKAWEKEPTRYWKEAPAEVQDFIIPAIDAYYRDNDQIQRDEVMRSCGIAAQTLMLAATAMGYDSCPMDGFDYEDVAELIKLPEDHVVAMFVAIGKGTKDVWPKPGQLPLKDVIIDNTF